MPRGWEPAPRIRRRRVRRGGSGRRLAWTRLRLLRGMRLRTRRLLRAGRLCRRHLPHRRLPAAVRSDAVAPRPGAPALDEERGEQRGREGPERHEGEDPEVATDPTTGDHVDERVAGQPTDRLGQPPHDVGTEDDGHDPRDDAQRQRHRDLAWPRAPRSNRRSTCSTSRGRGRCRARTCRRGHRRRPVTSGGPTALHALAHVR